jgi:hypothetical protein
MWINPLISLLFVLISSFYLRLVLPSRLVHLAFHVKRPYRLILLHFINWIMLEERYDIAPCALLLLRSK